MIRQKLRQLGNFLINTRKLDSSVTTLESAINPNKYDNFVKAVRLCAGYNPMDGSYRAPSLLNAEKLAVECVKRADGKVRSAVESWLSVYGTIDMILKYRSDANVQYDNPYVFGRGARSVREAANSCGAKQPALLRGTKLRKHIATVSQAMNLTENELGILADYLGHSIDIHRHFYRLPNEAIHLAKISQLLFALDTNTIHKYKGKPLEDVNIDEDNDFSQENCSSEMSEANDKDVYENLRVKMNEDCSEQSEDVPMDISGTTETMDYDT
ncbi:hypothetical protein CBL_21109, partial [Carabus blaptoides fortunei]